MVYSEEVKALELFNLNTEKLFSGRYVKYAQEMGDWSFVLVNDESPTATRRNLPDQKTINEFLATFKFFVQEDEETSFSEINKIYDQIQIASELKENFFKEQKTLNNYLNGENLTQIKNLTKREILNVFVFAGLSHKGREGLDSFADKSTFNNAAKKRATYDNWQANDKTFKSLELQFYKILGIVLATIKKIAKINAEVISELFKTTNLKQK